MDRTISVASDFTTRPGLRTPEQTPGVSGMEFREQFLEPQFATAVKEKSRLIVDLSGTSGFPPSFLEEAFGGLVRKWGLNTVQKHVTLVGHGSSLRWVTRANRLMIRAEKNNLTRTKKTHW